MNKFIHSKLYLWLIAIITFITCYNGSMITTESEEKAQPDLNFYGTLEDHNHKSEVEEILIGGKYESIPFYHHAGTITYDKNNTASTDIDIDPKQNKTLINLDDIQSIALLHPNRPTASTIIINNKPYIEISIESKHGNKRTFLVETSRKITCKEIDKGADLKDGLPVMQQRDLNFIHVKKIIIKGQKNNIHKNDIEVSSTSKTFQEKEAMIEKELLEEKKLFKNNTEELLHAIEENVKNLPLDNPSAFETMRSTILTLLKSLRDQLQKFLDMIK